MIRLARESDAKRIGELWEEMVVYHAQFDQFTFRAAENGAMLYERRLLERMGDPQSRVLVAEADGEVGAYASAVIADITTEMFQPLRCGLLADIYVSEPYRRRGWGRALVERLCLWFRDQNVSHFEWHVSARNQEALAFWEALGGDPTILRMRANVPGAKT